MLIRPESVKVVTLNAQSIVNRSEEFIDFLQDNKPDLVLLNETWLMLGDSFTVPNFRCYRRYRLGGPGRGVAVLVRQSTAIQFSEHREHSRWRNAPWQHGHPDCFRLLPIKQHSNRRRSDWIPSLISTLSIVLGIAASPTGRRWARTTIKSYSKRLTGGKSPSVNRPKWRTGTHTLVTSKRFSDQ